MNYLQEAISKIEQSEGDVTNNYQVVLIRQAELCLQLSIAQSLKRIANALEEIKSTSEQYTNFKVNRANHGQRGLP